MFAYIENSEVSVYPVTMSWIKSQHPNVSFPRNLSDINDLTSFNIVEVIGTDQPTYNDDTQYLQELSPEFVDGQWRQRWNIVSFSDDVIAKNAAMKGQNMRGIRNELLAQCDWTQLVDSPVDKTAWATYRQSLRDLPTQTGFPDNITWPTKPS